MLAINKDLVRKLARLEHTTMRVAQRILSEQAREETRRREVEREISQAAVSNPVIPLQYDWGVYELVHAGDTRVLQQSEVEKWGEVRRLI